MITLLRAAGLCEMLAGLAEKEVAAKEVILIRGRSNRVLTTKLQIGDIGWTRILS